ncbi:adhesin domain containing protein [uncultured Anaerococcus sp.]|uniref:adhesin domain containing protein n=1 Tax=uncultured Anaerococcus sp. TaxID=293428 RepID=UPI0028894BDF|nr:adhesin domain containing protein [uncultured Anaerococcus sp.]
MNKKQKLLAIALSASFVLAGANVADANEQVQTENVSQVIDNKAQADLPQGQASKNEAKSEEKSETADAKPLGMEISEEKTPKAQKAAAENSEPNYSEEEKNIKDYSDSERYKETDLTPGSTIVGNVNTDEGVVKDGFKFDTKNPSPTSPSKTEYGYLISIDKKTGQRTYTKINVTDSGRILVNTGDKPMMGEGEKLTPDSPDVTYKPDEDGDISGKRQKLYNYEASEETLKHINSKDNDTTIIGMKDNYTKDNPPKKYFDESFAITYKVNPWPNENDKLQLMKLNGEYNKKVFVQGQDIDTKVKVDNIDANAKERLVGQVYNPITGKIVPGASAYIGDDGNIHIKMPEGALKKDESGKTVINEDSIFNTPDYKALQNLDVKFFARPRTAEEFKTIAETPDESGETGTYTGSGAGTEEINHAGKKVNIDKQGIDRYDHYNLIGGFKLNLDDTRYYNQSFEDQNGDDTSKNTSSNIRPNEPFKVHMFTPKDPSKTDKSAEEMNAADNRGEANGRLIMDFIKKANEGKSEDDKWKIEASPNNISEFSITAPASAKAGDFIAIPVEYTYTNGSKNIHWFHFVVKESDNNVPKYESEAGIAGKELKKTPELSQTDAAKKKLQPKSYKLAKTEYKDDKGNVWNVSIDETTGEVTATVPGNDKIPETGTKLNVDVEVTYEEEVEVGDKKETKTYTEKTRAQFYSIPSTRQEVKKEYETKLPFETKLIYDETIPAGKVIEEGGKVGKQKMVFSQIVVGNKKGAIIDGKFVEGKEAVTTEVVEKAQDKIIRIGTKPAEITVEIPFDTDYELDYTKKKGEEPTQVTEGKKGVVTIKTTRDPETGEIKITQEVTKEATNRKLSIPAGTEGTKVHKEKLPFGYEIQYDENLEAGKYVVDEKGKEGSKTTTWTIKNSEIVGDPTEKIEKPVNAVIRVGKKLTKNTCPVPGLPNTPEDESPHNPVGEKPNNSKTPEDNNKNPEKTEGNTPTTPETKPENPKGPSKPDEDKKEKDKPSEPENPGSNPKSPEKPGKQEEAKPSESGENPVKPQVQSKANQENSFEMNKSKVSEKPNQNSLTLENSIVIENPSENQKENKISKEIENSKEFEIPRDKENSKEESKVDFSDVLSKKDKKESENSDSDELSMRAKKKSTNPKTGISSIAPIFTSMGLSISGLFATKKKKKEDQ